MCIRDRYNKVQAFYHAILLKQMALLKLSNHQALREMEKWTIGSKKGEEPVYPLPFGPIPLYFRRAAINGALSAARSYVGRLKTWQEKKDRLEQEGKLYKAPVPKPVQEFHCAPVFYKGQYKNFTTKDIILKLWTGNSWAWVKHTFRGRALPLGAERMSPSVVLHKKTVRLHIPVKEAVLDVRPVKERLKEQENICAIRFTNGDSFAVCCVFSGNGGTQATRFIRGVKQYVHRSKGLQNKIRKNRKLMGTHFDWKGCNQKYWRQLYNLSNANAHRVSKEIVDFCVQNQVKVITMAKIEEDAPWFKKRMGVYSVIYLSKRIIRYLQYKAWKQGIVITSVNPQYTAKKCAQMCIRDRYICKFLGKCFCLLVFMVRNVSQLR